MTYVNHSVNITVSIWQMENINNRSAVRTKAWVISTSHFQRKKADDEFTATALWHWLLAQTRCKNQAPEIKMSDCQSQWCHCPHLSPSLQITASSGGLGRPWDTERGPPSLHTHTLAADTLFSPSLHQCHKPCRQEAVRMAALPSHQSGEERGPWAADRNLTPGLMVWRETVNYPWADLISSPVLMILYLNWSASRNKEFVKCTHRPTFAACYDSLFAVTNLPPHYSYISAKKQKKQNKTLSKFCVYAQHGEWVILSDALRAERPSLWAVQPRLTRKREELVCVCVPVGETLFLDVTAQPSLPLLSNTSLLFRGFHQRPVIRKTRSPACKLAGAGRGLPRITHTHTHFIPSYYY